MKFAFIFPGQASQYVGMAKDLYEKYELARNYFTLANQIMELDLARICFEGPEEKLKQTSITQPAIFVHSCIMSALLAEKDILPEAVAGHSLGEYSALVASGSLSYENGLMLVKERSRLMYEAGQKNPGTMGAIIGLNEDDVNKICKEVSKKGVVQPANFNSPGQIAISGDKQSVLRALDLAKEKGSKKAVELVVSGAFHSPLMEDARQGLAKALQNVKLQDSNVPFYSNVSGKKVTKSSQIKDLLLKQLTSPVLWENIIVNMAKDKYNNFLEVGPGKVLKGLLKRIDRELECRVCGTDSDLVLIDG